MKKIIPDKRELDKYHVFPNEKRLSKGPVVIVECIEEIPCDVCESGCPLDVIRVGKEIVSIPKVNHDKCTGCKMCITSCPGLAIFVVDKSFSKKEAVISFPFEYLPVPKKGSLVKATNRYGEIITEGKVLEVSPAKDHTIIVSIVIPIEFIHQVRSIKRCKNE
jgi:Fe-S-cluster-containing hydrogenase component 2